MILSVSRRTDIPAFYSEWFYNRIKEGFVLVRNPMNIHQISRINLAPDIVDCIVFWTKNPSNFIKSLNLLDKYKYYFQYTITSYGLKLEPNVPSFSDVLKTFKSLSQIIGKDKVVWRYDPIIITNEYNTNYHVNNFNKIAQELNGYTNKCIISFVDYYKKTIKNLSNITYFNITKTDIVYIVNSFKKICSDNNIELTTCAEEIDLDYLGISHGKCIDDKLIEEIIGCKLNITKDKTQRNECGCIASVDIGAYNTCMHNCLYCYANYDMPKVKLNYLKHKQESELLTGSVENDDKITSRKLISCKDLQRSLFDNNK